jgi:sugar lactone lactonase YvrE
MRHRIAASAALAASVIATGAAAKDIRIDDVRVFPESLSATADGTVYTGSIKGIVFRAPKGAAFAEPWIAPTEKNGLLSILGVLADARSRTLWVCSAPSPIRTPPAVGVTALMAFDLKTGGQRGVYPFPAPAGACNDMTVAKDGAVYAADTPNGRIFVLKRGAKALALFAQDDRLKGIDGIAFSGDGTLYLNIVSKGQLMRVDRGPDSAMSGLTELKLSQPVAGPDGFRLIAGNRFLLAEGNGGRIDQVEIRGDEAQITVLKEGLMSPPGVTMAGKTAYAMEGKIGYLIDPKLKGQDPGAFLVRQIQLPAASRQSSRPVKDRAP